MSDCKIFFKELNNELENLETLAQKFENANKRFVGEFTDNILYLDGNCIDAIRKIFNTDLVPFIEEIPILIRELSNTIEDNIKEFSCVDEKLKRFIISHNDFDHNVLIENRNRLKKDME